MIADFVEVLCVGVFIVLFYGLFDVEMVSLLYYWWKKSAELICVL